MKTEVDRDVGTAEGIAQHVLLVELGSGNGIVDSLCTAGHDNGVGIGLCLVKTLLDVIEGWDVVGLIVCHKGIRGSSSDGYLGICPDACRIPCHGLGRSIQYIVAGVGNEVMMVADDIMVTHQDIVYADLGDGRNVHFAVERSFFSEDLDDAVGALGAVEHAAGGAL